MRVSARFPAEHVAKEHAMAISRSIWLSTALGFGLASVLSVAGAQTKPPVAPVRPVVDSYFGVAVTDPYRWMEAGGTELQDYMRAQNAVTKEALAPLAKQTTDLLDRLTDLSRAVPSVRSPKLVGDMYFYLQIPPDSNDLILMVRAVAGGSGRVLLEPGAFAQADKHAAIDYFVPSWDGQRVIVGVSLGGSENSTIYIVETKTGRLLPESITRTQDADPSWDEDGKGFHYARLQPLPDGAPALAKYANVRVYHHLLGWNAEQDEAVFGPDVSPELALPKIGHVAIEHLRVTKLLLASQVTGAVETPAFWRRVLADKTWQPIVRHEDGVLRWAAHGTWLFVISKAGPVNGQVLRFDAATQGFADARVVMPPSDLVLSALSDVDLVAAKDALYVLGMRDGLAVVRRLAYEPAEATAQATELALPIVGSARGVTGDDRHAGITVGLSGWIVSPRFYRYEPSTRAFADTQLQLPNPADYSSVTSVEVEAQSADGTKIPLSIIVRKDAKLDGSNPTLLDAYGAYGVAYTPSFNTASLPWLERGGILAIAHVRGGGEKGEAWHLAGTKQTKQHTIDDFVACARYLIEQHFTSRAHLGIEGTSAGGIAVGGFLTQHPELVSAVLYRVGITDILRSEQRATGTENAAEYGSVKVESEFRPMYAVSPYAHVVDGTAYPAVMLETGANDPRVTSWMLTKMTARLQQASGSSNPILLRVDFDAGHGVGSNRSQALKLKADEYAFLGWRLGMHGFEIPRQP
jgi:prolyl oligopeptidase